MIAVACPEDLLVLSRRRELDPTERRTLADHLDGCDLCRMSAAIGRAVSGNEADEDSDQGSYEDWYEDGLLAARLVDRTLTTSPVRRAVAVPATSGTARRRARSNRRQVPTRWAAAAAAILLLAGSASAAIWRAWRRAEEARVAREAPAAEAEKAHRRARTHTRLASAGSPVEASAVEPPAVEPEPTPAFSPPPLPLAGEGRGEGRPSRTAPPSTFPLAPIAPTSPSPTVAPTSPPAFTAPPARLPNHASATPPAIPPPPSAEALFRAASEARGARHFDEAVRLYRTLQADYPGSEEAAMSRLSLGDLHLAHGAPARALAQFDAYLAAPAPELGEEALLGKARALSRLGRAADERAVWNELVTRYPGSEYRWLAQRRLSELSRERP